MEGREAEIAGVGGVEDRYLMRLRVDLVDISTLSLCVCDMIGVWESACCCIGRAPCACLSNGFNALL